MALRSMNGRTEAGGKLKTIRSILCIFLLLCTAGLCYGVDGGVEVFGGSSIKDRSGGALRNMQVGLGISMFGDYGKSDFASGYFLEVNSISLKDLHSDHVVFSANYAGSTMPTNRLRPFFTAGYSRIFGAGNALNYGAGIDYIFSTNDYHAVRFEARNYWKFSGARENNTILRAGYFIFFGGD
jgi:hypothetical protein